MDSVEATLGLTTADAGPRKWRWLGLAALLALISVIVYFLFFRTTEPGVTYRTEAVRRGGLTLSVSATGRVEPLTQVAVGTEISGIIEEVLVDVNDRVRVGQVLARLNTDRLMAQVRQSRAAVRAAEASLAQTRATLVESRSTLERLTLLGDNVTEVEREAARASVQRAEAEEVARSASITQSRASLSAVESDLARGTIRSPINGIVLDRQVDPGQTVAASFQTPTLFVLAEDLTEMRLEVDVDEADIGRVRIGQPATFTTDAYPGRRFESEVMDIGNLSQTSGGVVTYVALLSAQNPELLLKPGMTATADIIVAQVDSAMLVPNAALRFVPDAVIAAEAEAAAASGGGGTFLGMRRPAGAGGGRSPTERNRRVWVVRDGAPVAVAVSTGATDGTWTEVLGGDLEVGDGVIVDAIAPPAGRQP